MVSFLADALVELKVPPALVPQCEAALTGVIFLSLIGTSESRLNQAEKSRIHVLWGEHDVPGIFSLIQGKYAPSEWQGYLMGIVEPIVQDYLKSVL